MVTHTVLKHTKHGYVQVGSVALDGKGRQVLTLDGPVSGKLLLHPVKPQKQEADSPPWDDPAGIGHGPLCPCPTCQARKTAAATKHPYDIPPEGFDDTIPF